jgi:peptidoglycan hydrolase-like protein with peptidoglycan-binding domain
MMKRALALLTAGVLVGTITAHSATAQSTAPAKPNPSTSMQHNQTTGSKMKHDSTAVSSNSSAAKQKWSKEQIKEAQAGLTKAGFYKEKQDGEYGKSTRKAVKAYQKANKLPVTGQLSDSLLTRLRSS